MLKSARLLAAAAIGVSSIIALPAAAQPVVRVAVSHADLDLTTQAGQDTLQSRLDRAASYVCRIPNNAALTTAQDEARCYRQARGDVRVFFAMALAGQPQRGG